MTREEFENNYQFKVTKKCLMREFPFILDVSATYESINQYVYTLLIDIVINPYILSNMFGVPIWDSVTNKLKRGEDYVTPYFGVLIDSSDYSEQGAKITNLIHTFMDSIGNTPALPSDFKLNKKLRIGSITAKPSSLPPDLMQ